jgi:ATP-dependent RNA helicase DOB1
LEHCVLDTVNDYKPTVLLDSKNVFYGDRYSAWSKERREGVLAHDRYQEKVKAARKSGHEGPIAGKTRPKSFEHELNETLNKLSERTQLPAIVFVFSRAGCERLASAVSSNFLDSSEAAAVKHIWNFHLSRYRDSLETSPQFHSLLALAERGIAYHHSGLLPFMKEILEILFSKGLIRVLFATETFAVGINMPTKTVVFTALEKFTDGGVRGLTTSEYLQMAGRAGRRGKDDKGLVLYLPQREPLTVS